MATAQDTVEQTLSMLEERLERISFVVTGNTESLIPAGTTESSGSAGARLRALERGLNALAAKSFTVSDVLQLNKRQPELFHPSDSQSAPSTLPPAALLQLILAHEDLYKSSATHLSSLNDTKEVPDSTPMSKLLDMEARIEKLQAKQAEQAQEFADLRTKSAQLVEQWYETGVLDMGGRWAEWEARMRDCEIMVRRKEAEKRREEGAV